MNDEHDHDEDDLSRDFWTGEPLPEPRRTRRRGFRWSIGRAAPAGLIIAAVGFATSVLFLLGLGREPFSGELDVVVTVMIVSLVLIIPFSLLAGAFDDDEWWIVVVMGSLLMIPLCVFLTLVIAWADGMASFR